MRKSVEPPKILAPSHCLWPGKRHLRDAPAVDPTGKEPGAQAQTGLFVDEQVPVDTRFMPLQEQAVQTSAVPPDQDHEPS